MRAIGLVPILSKFLHELSNVRIRLIHLPHFYQETARESSRVVIECAHEQQDRFSGTAVRFTTTFGPDKSGT